MLQMPKADPGSDSFWGRNKNRNPCRAIGVQHATGSSEYHLRHVEGFATPGQQPIRAMPSQHRGAGISKKMQKGVLAYAGADLSCMKQSKWTLRTWPKTAAVDETAGGLEARETELVTA